MQFKLNANQQELGNLFGWWPIVLGLVAMFLPTLFGLLNGIWQTDDQAHGPIVLAVVLFLTWQKRAVFSNGPNNISKSYLGWLLLFFGLACYVVGRSQDILVLEIGSIIFVLSAVLWITRGPKALKTMWFPLFFIMFMIPLPSFVVGAITLPMKIAVSNVAEVVLYWFNYPIARSGVILQIGQYQLLVADACAGMNTLISLEALGLIYLSLVKHDSLFRNVMLALLIIPISFSANVIRVITLTLVTYYYGDAAGQGFVHGFAGLVLFMVALGLIMLIDSALQHTSKLAGKLYGQHDTEST